jgi:glycosyltransferase involved in cell wall biosynthesis
VVIPLRLGGDGAKLKLLEALSLAKAVVTTPIGCSGVEVEHGRHVLIAQSPRDFATEVLRVMSDDGLRDALGRLGRSLVVERYAARTAAEQLKLAYERARHRATDERRPLRQARLQRLQAAAYRSLRLLPPDGAADH